MHGMHGTLVLLRTKHSLASVAMLILVMTAPGVLLASQNPITVLAVTVSPASVPGGGSTSGNTVTLSAPAPAGGVLVPLGSNSDLAAVSASVAVAQGQTVSVRFTITTLNVGIDTTISISATYGSVTKKANLTILKVSNFSQTPLIDYQSGQMYLGIYPGRLYKGSNTPPADHDAAGQLAAAAVQPLDYYGNADPMGRIGLISIGPSVTTAEWCDSPNPATHCAYYSFTGQAASNASVNHSTLTIIDGAHAGASADTWTCAFCVGTSSNPNEYDRVRDTILTPMGLSEKQVQVVWVATVIPYPVVELPQSTGNAFQEEIAFGQIVRAAKQRWPNVQQIFFSGITYTGYATTHQYPEPYGYENSFAVRWTVGAQINQRRTGTIDPLAGDVLTNEPFIAWGPYLWGNGTANPPGSQAITWVQSDFIADGLHPSTTGVTKVGTALLNFFLASDLTPWFRAQ